MSQETGRPVSGDGMDVRIAPRPRRRKRIAALAVALSIVLVAGWYALPRGQQVALSEVSIATVEQTRFNDSVIVRSSVQPAVSVRLDTVESGRVEEVRVKDGAMVKKGDILFRLSNPQRQLELLARQSDLAQQFSNLAGLRVGYETTRSEYRRRLSDARFALEQTGKTHERNEKLAQQGFISRAALEESEDRLRRQQRDVKDEEQSRKEELRIKHDALQQMEKALDGLKSGLGLASATVEALAVRAPIDGIVSGLELQIGQSVKVGDRVGRVDSPGRFRLQADVDQFYLNRLVVGQKAGFVQDGKGYVTKVSRIHSEVKDGKFTAELVFEGAAPQGLRTGQSIDCRIELGQPRPARVLPNGAWLADSGGQWVYVLSASGRVAEKRPVRTGQRTMTQVEIIDGLKPGERVVVSGYAAFGKSERLELNE